MDFQEMASKSGKLSRDRTREFLTIVERLKKSAPASEQHAPSSSSGQGSRLNGVRSALSIHSEFNKRASKIGLGIHQTSQMLSKLAIRKFSIVMQFAAYCVVS